MYPNIGIGTVFGAYGALRKAQGSSRVILLTTSLRYYRYFKRRPDLIHRETFCLVKRPPRPWDFPFKVRTIQSRCPECLRPTFSLLTCPKHAVFDAIRPGSEQGIRPIPLTWRQKLQKTIKIIAHPSRLPLYLSSVRIKPTVATNHQIAITLSTILHSLSISFLLSA